MASLTTHTASFRRHYYIPIFFVLAFALSWLVWGSEIAEEHGLLSFHIPDTFAYFALTLATLIVTAFTGGKAALWDILRRILRWRVGIRWYAFALLIPIALAFVPAGIYLLVGGLVPIGINITLSAAVAYFGYFGAKLLITEELAWRGFALPRLLATQSALFASVLLGLLWGIWHTPLFLIAGTGQSHWPYVGFVLFTIAESILITWIYNNTGGSVLLTTVFHAASDAALAYSGVLYGDQVLFWIAVTITWVAAIVVVLIEGPTHLVKGKTNHITQIASDTRKEGEHVRIEG